MPNTPDPEHRGAASYTVHSREHAGSYVTFENLAMYPINANQLINKNPTVVPYWNPQPPAVHPEFSLSPEMRVRVFEKPCNGYCPFGAAYANWKQSCYCDPDVRNAARL